VQDAYSQLGAEGYLVALPGSATRVADVAVTPQPASPPDVKPSRLALEFSSGVPDLASFPRADWLWAQREVLRSIPNSALDYGDPQGDEHFREVIAAYLRRVRGADADAARLVVCAGFAQGLALALRVLAAAGVRRVGFEDPGFGERTRSLAERSGIHSVPIAVDDLGINVDALAASGVTAVVLTPAHQWPTGVVLAPTRRQALIAWAMERGATIIEDDYDAEIRYDRDPVGALQGLAPDHVIMLGTTSKSLAPALRLGWMVCPASLTGAVVSEKSLLDRGAPTLDQRALASLLESGRYDRHLRRMRAVYSGRRDTLTAALAEHAPSVQLTGLAAGFHTVAHLPAGRTEQQVIKAARERSVGLHGMSAHRSTGSATPPQLILGFGNLDEQSVQRGIATIGDLLDPVTAGRSRPAPRE
jgi:GntR family transcriptional regulator/MocR family aminotransferase